MAFDGTMPSGTLFWIRPAFWAATKMLLMLAWVADHQRWFYATKPNRKTQ